MPQIFRNTISLLVFIFLLGACAPHTVQQQATKPQAVKELPKLVSTPLEWKSSDDHFPCEADGAYPQVLGGNTFCKTINKLLANAAHDKLNLLKETCEALAEETEEATNTNPEENSLSLSFKGGLNEMYLSIGTYAIQRAAGAAYSNFSSTYYNYNLITEQAAGLSDFISVDQRLVQLILNDISLENEYTNQDQLSIERYLSDLSKIKFRINQESLEISLDALDGELSFNNREYFVELSIENISDLLKISATDLPSEL